MKKSLLILAVGAVLLTSLPAGANSVTYTTTTPIPSTKTDWSGSLSFPQFDPSQGTLNSVTLYLSGSADTVLTIHNTGSVSSSGTANTWLQFRVQDGGNNLNSPEMSLIWPSAGYAYSLAAGASVTSGTLTKSGSSSDTYTSGAVLTEFTGLGSIVLPASTFTQTLLANTGGNTDASQVTLAALTGTVTYDYTTTVPDGGSTLVLLGTALAGMASLRRRFA